MHRGPGPAGVALGPTGSDKLQARLRAQGSALSTWHWVSPPSGVSVARGLELELQCSV